MAEDPGAATQAEAPEAFRGPVPPATAAGPGTGDAGAQDAAHAARQGVLC